MLLHMYKVMLGVLSDITSFEGGILRHYEGDENALRRDIFVHLGCYGARLVGSYRR